MSLFEIPGKTIPITGAMFALPQKVLSPCHPPASPHSPGTLISSCVGRLSPARGKGASELGQALP